MASQSITHESLNCWWSKQPAELPEGQLGHSWWSGASVSTCSCASSASIGPTIWQEAYAADDTVPSIVAVHLSNDDHLALDNNMDTEITSTDPCFTSLIDSHDEDTVSNHNHRDHHLEPDKEKPFSTKGGIDMPLTPVKLEYVLECIADLHEPKLGSGVHLSNDDHLAPGNKNTRITSTDPFTSLIDSHDEDTTTTSNHTYHDHHLEPDTEKPFSTKGGVDMPFPIKLYHMFEYIDLHEPELASIISWQPHGRSFLCRDVAKMEKLILPIFFKHSNFNSFRRQLNMWGFIRLNQKGPDNGAYYHDLFLRSKRYLCHDIKKNKRSRFVTFQEPRFYAMPVLSPHSMVTSTSGNTIAAAPTSSSHCSSSSTGAPLEEEDSALNYWLLSLFETPDVKDNDTSASSTKKRKLHHSTSQSHDMYPSSCTLPDIVLHGDKTNIWNTVAERISNKSVGAGTLFTTSFLRNWQHDWQLYADRNGIVTGRLEQGKTIANGESNQYSHNSFTADMSLFKIGRALPMTDKEGKETLAVLAKIGRL